MAARHADKEYARTHLLPVGLSSWALNEDRVAMTLEALDGRDDTELHIMAVQVDTTGSIKCDDELVERPESEFGGSGSNHCWHVCSGSSATERPRWREAIFASERDRKRERNLG